jgi:hypothetical protein
MTKNTNKTHPERASVRDYIDSLADSQKRREAKALLKLMREATGEKPIMWGKSMIGFGKYHYKYKSGREGDYFIVGFSSRQANLTVYVLPNLDSLLPLPEKLGHFKHSSSCLYIKRLDDIHLPTLKRVIKSGYQQMQKLMKQGDMYSSAV